MGTIISQISAATGMLTLAISMRDRAAKASGNALPSTMPTMMQPVTHAVSHFSKKLIPGVEEVDVSLMRLRALVWRNG